MWLMRFKGYWESLQSGNTGLLALFLLTSGMLGACAALGPIDAERQRRALGLIDQGVLLMRQGELERAEAAFEVSHELVPGAAAIDGLGCVALLRGESERAEALFNEALEFDFGYTQALGNLALLYEQIGQKERAEACYQRALREDPANFRIRNNYAIFLAHQSGSDDPHILQQMLRAAVLDDSVIIQANLRKISERKN